MSLKKTPSTSISTNYSNFLDILKEDIANKPDSEIFTFLENDGRSTDVVSYKQLEQLVSKIASALSKIKHNDDKQDKAIILLPTGKHFVASFYACMAGGIIAVPSFPPKNKLQLERLQYALKDLKDPIIISDQSLQHTLLPKLTKEVAHLRWVAIEECMSENTSSLQNFSAKPSDIAMLQYSSGTTGKPKGIIITNRNLIQNSALIKESFDSRENETRAVIWLPPQHDMGLMGIVLQGVYTSYPTFVMPTDMFLRSQFRWLEWVTEYKATATGGPNIAFELCSRNISNKQLEKLDLSSVKVAFCGAEPVNYQTMVEFNKKFSVCGFKPEAILPCYGMAEATLMISGCAFDKPFKSLTVNSKMYSKNIIKQEESTSNKTHTLVSCGQVHPSMNLKIVDPNLQLPISEGEVGEIWISGSSVSMGYWNDPEKTSQLFNRKLFQYEGDFHRTGDLGFILDNEIYITGRIKEIIILRGANYYPQDIEHEVSVVCPEFKNCRSIAFSIEENRQEILVLAIEVPRTLPDFKATIRKVNGRLIDMFGIKATKFVFIPRKTIRLTSSGKLQRADIKSAYQNNTLKYYFDMDEESSSNNKKNTNEINLDTQNLESIVNWIMSEASKITDVDFSDIKRDEPLSSIGLDSVAAMEILFNLESKVNVSIPIESLYTSNTPLLLASDIYKQLNKKSNIKQMASLC